MYSHDGLIHQQQTIEIIELVSRVELAIHQICNLSHLLSNNLAGSERFHTSKQTSYVFLQTDCVHLDCPNLLRRNLS